MKTLLTLLSLVFLLTATLSAAEKYQLSTHVLDTTLGKPGVGVKVTLEKRTDEGKWIKLQTNTTNNDGRINSFLELKDKDANNGVYRFTFSLEEYFENRGEETIFPEAVIVFRIKGDGHYHIPLVVTPYALSTYRGS
jgi:5-hydroxyisourate hydrolase